MANLERHSLVFSICKNEWQCYKNSPKLRVILFHSSFVFRVVARRLNWPFWLKFAPCNKRLWSYLKAFKSVFLILPLYPYLTESRTQPYPSACFHTAFLNADPSIAFALVPGCFSSSQPSEPERPHLSSVYLKCTFASAFSNRFE